MPEFIDPTYQTYTPSGLVDSIDGNTTKRGGMISLQNLIPDPETAGFVVPRPAAYTLTSFPGFSSPGYVSVQKQIGSLIYGMIATSLNPGFDQPFAYNTLTNAFLTITGITGANVPKSPATSGAWTPPTVDGVGSKVIFTHPGFNGSNGYFGWLDTSGSSITSLTGTTNSVTNPTFITSVSGNPATAGVTVGMTIAGAGIPAGTTIVYFNTTTIIMSAAATASSGGVALTISGGTTTSPAWASGNTNTNPLPSVPLAVTIYTDRAYYACANVEYYSDVLNPLNMANATNSLTLGGSDPITASCGQPFFTTQTGGIIASLLIFKGAQIWQATGDLATNNLILNKLSDGVGTNAPRSIATTPLGTMFVASDGVRTVGLDGQVSEPNGDLRVPFLNPIVPSRLAAAYNVGFYRICTNYLTGGILTTTDLWLHTATQQWSGPHTLTYDSIIPMNATFLVTGRTFTGSILQSNVIPNEQTDFFTELGSNLSFVYQTVTVPEFRAMPGWSLEESSIFLKNDQQQNLTCNVIDQTGTVIATYKLLTPFLAPSNAANFSLFFTASGGGSSVTIPSRHAFQISGMSANNLGLGSVFAHYQYQDNNNAYDTVVDFPIPNSLDFGLVSDPLITVNMDWGSVADSVLSIVDFEVIGPLPGNP